MVFGSLDSALAAARHLHHRHATIVGRLTEAIGPFGSGSPYCANEAEALRWVHATLIETALIIHDLILPPLSVEERERYWAESRLYGALFGLTSADLPADWGSFAAYNAAMMHRIHCLSAPPHARWPDRSSPAADHGCGRRDGTRR
jgi:uncharacterized protein (DUF2236 family)